MTTFRQLVEEARTVRRFREAERIPESELRDLVDTARIAPCGGNQQRLRYRLVWKPEECGQVFPLLAWAALLKPWPGPATGERPAAYIVLCGPTPSNADTGIAAQTIQLAARERGYGACMLGSIQREAIKTALGIPDPLGVQLVVALGRPAEKVVLEEASAGGSLAYYRTPDQVHHVPKLPLSDVLV